MGERTVTSAEVIAAVTGDDTLLGTRVWRVPPGELIVGANVRSEIGDDPSFAGSIRDHGVLQPITCVVVVGALQVHMGQRRAVVAAEQGVASVPVIVTATPDEIGRVVDQLVENVHRRDLGAGDRARAVQQLALTGLTAAQVARRARLPRVDVDDALAVVASPVAVAAAEQHPELTLHQAAAVAAFDDDPDAVKALTEAAASGGFDHALAAAEDDHRDRVEHAGVLDQLRAAGVPGFPARPPRPARDLDELGLTHPDRHAGCPGHAGYPVSGGDVVDGRFVQRWHARYVCLQPDTHHGAPAPAARQPDLVDEQARQQRAQLAERRKAWRVASGVRRGWLREFARARAAPAPRGAERFVAESLLLSEAAAAVTAALACRHRLLRDLLYRAGDEPARPEDPEPASQRVADVEALLAGVAMGSPRYALRLTCALLLAAWDARTHADTWRAPAVEDARVMGQMVAWGYEPAAIEQLLLLDEADLADELAELGPPGPDRTRAR